MRINKGQFLAGAVVLAMGAVVLTVYTLPWNLRGIAYIALGMYLMLTSGKK